MTTAIVWFRRDLRLHDNPTLRQAAREAETVIPLYIFDDRRFQHDGMFALPKMSPYRARFVRESVKQLDNTLGAEYDSSLLVRQGSVNEVLEDVIEQYNVDALHYQSLPGTEERREERNVREVADDNDVSVNQHWTHTLYHLHDLPTSVTNIQDTFTAWRKQTESSADVRETVDAPSSIEIPAIDGAIPELSELGVDDGVCDERGVLPFNGGEQEALDRMQEYIWDGDNLRQYKKTRNGLLGEDYSSKFSAWLAQGCLSPRRVYSEVQQYEDERVENDSTYWLTFELMWRDFFQFQFVKHGDSFFTGTGIRDVDVSWTGDDRYFEAWANEQTGVPFVDANMRELNETGFMSNRGRQNVASFLTDVLNVDWRKGAAYFEAKLVDYDVSSNWGNWAYNAGVGNDSRDGRYFNVLRQGEKYDDTGQYIRHWLPELSSLPADATHRPWKLTERQQAAFDVQLGIDYPTPIVDVEEIYQRMYQNR